MTPNITRPALRYPGGKWLLGPWIISHFPYTPAVDSYVEPYGGADSVLIQKPRHTIETYNDLSNDLVNFFAVLRTQREELIQQIKLTPWARAEYEKATEPTTDPLEQARRWFVRCWMGIDGGSAYQSGWRIIKEVTRRRALPSYDTFNVDHLYLIAERFIGVQIENQPALKVMDRYDTPKTLFYLDPTYPRNTRKRWYYAYEMSDEDHVAMAKKCRQLSGYVLVSGYATLADGSPNTLYEEQFTAHGWARVDTNAQTNGGVDRVESLWLSPRLVALLEADKRGDHLPLMAFGRDSRE